MADISVQALGLGKEYPYKPSVTADQPVGEVAVALGVGVGNGLTELGAPAGVAPTDPEALGGVALGDAQLCKRGIVHRIARVAAAFETNTS